MKLFTTVFVLLVVSSVLVLGCARAVGNPVSPNIEGLSVAGTTASAEGVDVRDSHRLWGQFYLYFSDDHTSVDVVPMRQARLHLNALKFLESYCADCLKITQIKNNGDGTIDLTVKITHPFPDNPEYTGFDVKGIIMFQGSHEIPENIYRLPFYPENFRLSWRLLGDPELLNADGYSIYWSPWYDSGINMPIYKYWEGKYSNGTPTANVNGFLNFYSKEERHIFEVGAEISETYHISLPGGPVVAGYAVDACWEPPTVMPVTNPVEDFPITANQPEAYHFKVVFNDGLPIVQGDNCCSESSVHETRSEYERWYNAEGTITQYWYTGAWNEEMDHYYLKSPFGGDICDSLPDHPSWLCFAHYSFGQHSDGVYQLFGYAWHATTEPDDGGYCKALYPVFDVIEITIDLE